MHARQRRALRAAAASGVGTVFAAVSHTIGGGSAPEPWLVGAVIALSLPLTLVLVGRRMSLVGLTAAVLGAQALLHGLFSLFGDLSPVGGVAHVHSFDALPAIAHSVAATTTPGMVLAHVIAGLAAVVLLRHGERAAVALLTWARTLLRRALPQTSAPRPLPRAGWIARPRRTVVRAAAVLRLRGPPLGAC